MQGTGTFNDPYLVATAEDLNNIRNNMGYGLCYKQINDIDLSDYVNWEPIGSISSVCGANYDGDNFKITGLKINRPDENYIGLFGYIVGSVGNVNLVDVDIIGYSSVGSIAGSTTGSSIINRCSSGGSVNGVDNVGGLVGELYGTQVIKSKSNCSVSSIYTDIAGTLGGLVGWIRSSSVVIDSYSYGSVSNSVSTSIIGGLVGYVTGNLTYRPRVTNCYSMSQVTGTSVNMGGLVGYLYRGDIVSSYYSRNNNNNGTFVSESQLKQQATFVDWDFTDTWYINEGVSFPELRVFIDVNDIDPDIMLGTGTQEDPYLIRSPQNFNEIRNLLSSTITYYKQTKDIDMTDYANWISLSTGTRAINYDGQGFKISNISSNPSTIYFGVFGRYNSGIIQNVKVNNLSIQSTSGALTAFSFGIPLLNIDIDNINLTGTGMVHLARTNGDATNVSVKGNIESTTTSNENVVTVIYFGVNVKNCTFEGTMIGACRIGGISHGASLVENCVVRGDITGYDTAGINYGQHTNGTIVKVCLFQGTLIGSNTAAGVYNNNGMAGIKLREVTIQNCQVKGIVDGNSAVGIVYSPVYKPYYIYVDRCTCEADIYCNGRGSGIAYNLGNADYNTYLRITNCYALMSKVHNRAGISKIYYGRILTTTPTNSLVLQDCYALDTMVYVHHDTAEEFYNFNVLRDGQSITDTQAKQQSTYSAFDFTDIWGITTGYPYLIIGIETTLNVGKAYIIVELTSGSDPEATMFYGGNWYKYVSTIQRFPLELLPQATYEYGGDSLHVEGTTYSYLASGITDTTAKGGFGDYLADTSRTIYANTEHDVIVNFYYILHVVQELLKLRVEGKLLTIELQQSELNPLKINKNGIIYTLPLTTENGAIRVKVGDSIYSIPNELITTEPYIEYTQDKWFMLDAEGNLTYYYDEIDGEIANTAVFIPPEVEGIVVKKIKEGAFSHYNVDEVYIPQNVTEIETGAFDTNSLLRIEIKTSTAIVGEAFGYNFSNLYAQTGSGIYMKVDGNWRFIY